MEIKLNRARVIKELVLQMTEELPVDIRQRAVIHLFGVAQAAVAIAIKRGLNPEIAYICGLLHDYYKYKTDDREDHAVKCGDMVLPLLAKSGLFSVCEIGIISGAIAAHSDKDKTGSEYQELLKDADVMQRYLADAVNVKPMGEQHVERSKKLKKEFFEKGDTN